VDGTDLESCPLVGFGTCGVELLGLLPEREF
jgi:hypothetical protein